MPIVLPSMSSRVIYVDADMLILPRFGRSVASEPQGDHALLAVTDIAAPRIDAPNHLPSFERCRGHLAGFTPIANFRELGLPQDGHYFNGGMLVVDLGCRASRANGSASDASIVCGPTVITCCGGSIRPQRRPRRQVAGPRQSVESRRPSLCLPDVAESPLDRQA